MKSSSSTGKQTPPGNLQVALEAAEWLVRLMDTDFDPEEIYPNPLERQNAFFDWLNQAPEHVRAFLEVMEVERRTRHPDPDRLINIDDPLSALRQTVVPIPDHLSNANRATPQARINRTAATIRPAAVSRRHWWIPISVAAAGATAVGIRLLYAPQSVTASSVYYATSVGERQTISLKDGSVAILNAATKLAVTFDHHTREVRLLAGEAFFDVRHDASRPFRVIADDVFLEDLGTQFDVDRRPTTTRVTVAKGSVQLTCGCVTRETPSPTINVSERISGVPTHPSATIMLTAGDEVNVAYADGTLTRHNLDPDELTQAIGWKDGEVWLSGEILSAAVEKLNRYSTHHIVITDASIANVRVDGMCRSSQPEDCARVLGHASGVVVLPPDPDEPNAIRLGRNSMSAAARTEAH